MPQGTSRRLSAPPGPGPSARATAGAKGVSGHPGRTAGGGTLEVQIFGTRNDADTRKALRFFSERRVRTHFVDLKQRAASKGELARFVERFGADRLVDAGSKRFAALGLRTAHYGAERWLDILADEPLLLRTPLVRWKAKLTVGLDEAAWEAWVAEGKP